MPKAEVKTDYPGIVSVRAVESRAGLLRENSICGFLGVGRMPGEVFQINRWEEFSPRWMEFVEPDKLPEGWQAAIDAREAQRATSMAELAALNAKAPAEIQADMVALAVKQTITTLAGAQALNQGPSGKAIPSHEAHYGADRKRA